MYQWTLSPTKALERQRAKDKTQDDNNNANNIQQQQQQQSSQENDSSGNRADAAERALLRIKQVKLTVYPLDSTASCNVVVLCVNTFCADCRPEKNIEFSLYLSIVAVRIPI
jgi:hypothetical protein